MTGPRYLPGGQQVVIVRPGTVADRYGDSHPDWTAATRTTVTGAVVSPFAATENVVDRDMLLTNLRLILPAGTDIAAADHVECAGDTYEVDGEPARWADDLGVPDHVEALLKRVAG